MKFLFLKKLTALALAATSGANALDGKYVLRGSAGNDAISMESTRVAIVVTAIATATKEGMFSAGSASSSKGPATTRLASDPLLRLRLRQCTTTSRRVASAESVVATIATAKREVTILVGVAVNP
eukprot:CAMPEP_0172546142 /NCGR_PEP_ID=MMETSP1067-20121228/15954_1 /TAXON_ID=265564 ORGANISM="Thalassiosira punctigera, Strain Tpunct2005C2" /NCGR_SAMPLE_ID=MMETSP1067 /ASSEMBLY_ACC=CAM_ASM_000444 /LENGTH=124 /DNA_ID=CAMNT_0013333025 /DNA_START=63 /DNA_END=434 /DNA_ORIENTATION=+